MKDIDIEAIKKKSLVGILALTSQTFLLQLIAFGATFLLTIFLSPRIFGVFYVVSAIISFLTYFSDVGLAAALIQKKEDLTHEDLETTFTIQQILVGSVTIIALVFSGQIAAFYRLDIEGLWLLRSLIISFFISSLKTIPSVLLERRLDFNKLVIPQIIETLCFYIIAVVMAWKGFGAVSFTWAVLARAVVGLIAMYVISPWRLSLGLSRPVARKLLRFGVPFQLNSFLALLKDDLMTVFLGKILPFAQIGYIGWAKKWAEVPLRLIMDGVIQVTFPAFSRLQEVKAHLTKGIERTLHGMALSIFPISVMLVFVVHPLVNLIPKYTKWEPALTSFYLFAAAAMVASLSTPLTNALNAVGKIKVTLALMVMWVILTWIAALSLIHFFGFNGFAIAILVVSLTIVVVVKLTKQIAPFSFWKSIYRPVIGIAIQSVFYAVLFSLVPKTLIFVFLIAGIGGLVYAFVMWTIDRDRIQDLISHLFVK